MCLAQYLTKKVANVEKDLEKADKYFRKSTSDEKNDITEVLLV